MRNHRRRITSLAAIAALSLVGAAVPAGASHPTRICLELEQEQQYAVSNDDIVDAVRAYPGATDADHPPEHEGCVTEQDEPGNDWGGTNIDFEITGAADPDSGDSPTTPDMTCTVAEGGGSCWAYPPTADDGFSTIRAWIDFDLNDATVEGDLTEGQDEASNPGDTAEPDSTDVSQIYWNRAEHRMETTVTIAFGTEEQMFHGNVRSGHPQCQSEREIKLFRLRRDGERVLVRTGVTDEEGSWEIADFNPRRGRFYAVTPRMGFDDLVGRIECLRDRSRTIEVD